MPWLIGEKGASLDIEKSHLNHTGIWGGGGVEMGRGWEGEGGHRKLEEIGRCRPSSNLISVIVLL